MTVLEQFTHLGSLPGADDITRHELENGLIVLCRSNFSSKSVVIRGYYPVGSLFDPPEKLGLAYFTASMLMRGTKFREFERIYEDLESAGASLGFRGATHTVGFSAKALAEDLAMLLTLVAEVLIKPIFPESDIEKLRAQLLTALALRAQNTGDMAALTFDEIVYPEHPYSLPEDGYPQTISMIQKSDLVDFHEHHYGPRGLVISIVGAVEPKAVIEMVAGTLGEWRNPEQPTPPPLPDLKPFNKTIKRKIDIPGKRQTDIVLGCAGPTRRAPEYLAASLGNSVLGQFGMYGRIGEVVREGAGLAYYAFSNLGGGLGPGPWSVSAGVNPDNIDKAIQLITKEIKRFVREKVTDTELDDSKANFVGRMPLSLETNAGVASALLNLERFDLGLDYYRQFPESISKITSDDVLATAQRYLDPKRLAIAIAGP